MKHRLLVLLEAARENWPYDQEWSSIISNTAQKISEKVPVEKSKNLCSSRWRNYTQQPIKNVISGLYIAILRKTVKSYINNIFSPDLCIFDLKIQTKNSKTNETKARETGLYHFSKTRMGVGWDPTIFVPVPRVPGICVPWPMERLWDSQNCWDCLGLESHWTVPGFWNFLKKHDLL